MSERIFICYRTADGADKATALARDLGRAFGEATVFLDKDDLRGGSAWRQVIDHTLDNRPVLLLLVTPQLLSATDASGQLRIAAVDDPVRRELEEALRAGAEIIPLLGDGLNGPPATDELPAPFKHIGELTWRPLRAYDWAHDVERLVGDLQALGIARVDEPAATSPARPKNTRPGRKLALALGLLIALTAIITALWFFTRANTATSLAGQWQAQLWQGEQVLLVLSETNGAVTLASAPIAIGDRPDWADYRRFWQTRNGRELPSIVYRGQGRRIDGPGTPSELDIALQVLPGPSSESAIDSGNLHLQLSADGQTLSGHIWLNGAQAEQPAMLKRQP